MITVPPSLRRRFLASALAGQFLFGIVLALLGTLFGIRAATDHIALDLDGRAMLLVILFSVQLAFTAVAGRFVDRWGTVRVLGAGSAFMAAALGVMAVADRLALAAASAALMALGGAGVNAASNALVSRLYGEQRGPMLNVLAMFSALGALSVPFVFASVDAWPDVSARLGLLAAAGVAATAWHLAQPPLPVPAHEHGMPRVRTRAIVRDRWVIALTVLLALDFANESVLAGWISTYTIGVMPGASGTLMVGLYWSALMTGRGVGPLLLARVPKLPFVAGMAALTLAGFLSVAASRSDTALALAVVFTGLTLGSIGPTILSVAGDRYTASTGAVFGVMLSLGQIGSVLGPWTVAQVTQAAGYRAGMTVPAVAAAAMVGVAALMLRQTGTDGHRRPVRAAVRVESS